MGWFFALAMDLLIITGVSTGMVFSGHAAF